MAKHYLKVIYYATETSWKSNSRIKVLVGLRHANGCFKKSFQCILVSLFLFRTDCVIRRITTTTTITKINFIFNVLTFKQTLKYLLYVCMILSYYKVQNLSTRIRFIQWQPYKSTYVISAYSEFPLWEKNLWPHSRKNAHISKNLVWTRYFHLIHWHVPGTYQLLYKIDVRILDRFWLK